MQNISSPEPAKTSAEALNSLIFTNDSKPQEGQTRIEIYTDGSCIGNPGYGGFGVVTLRRDADGNTIKYREASDYERSVTTNNRMEMTAACAALERLGEVTDEPIFVFCDANLITNGMNDWLEKWKANGWRKADGKKPENLDLWQRLERAAEGRNVTFAWVRGHSGTENNEKADMLARKAAQKAKKFINAGMEG